MKHPSQVLMSLQEVAGKENIARKMVDLAVASFEKNIASSDILTAGAWILSQLEEDPYLQNKLDRLDGLLEKRS